MSYELSKKEIVKEVIKSGKDPVYFINNYCKISHPMRGLISFKTYDFQDQLITDFNDHRFNVILKARQLGISTTVAAYVVWMMMFHRDKNVLVIATKFTTAANLVKKVKAMIKNLPPWIRISNISIDNRTSFELANGSQIKASSTSGDAGRSEALSLLVVDEAAHVDGLEELWTGLYPTLSTGGRCVALSTPNGVGNWFHQTYTDAEEEKNDFFPTILPWDLHPERDQGWYEKETRNMSRREIAQELECNFNTSGETVIHPDDMDWLANMSKQPKYKTGFDRNFWIWEEFKEEYSYLLVSDVARGDGADYSVFHLMKLETMEIVGEYQGKPNTDMFANFLCEVGKEYGGCMIVVENNSIGHSVLQKLIDNEYPNIYYSTKGNHEYIDPIEAESRSNAIPGFTMSLKTRPLVIAKLEEFVRNKLIRTYSNRVTNELKTFIWHNGKPEAMRGYNDDLVVALAIACWVKDTALTVNERDLAYNKAFLNSMVVSNTNIQTTISGQRGYKSILDHDKMSKSNKAIAEAIEYSWLYKG